MSDDTRQGDSDNEVVKFLVAEAADLLEQIAGAGTWKDVIEVCISQCMWPLDGEADIYDDAYRRELRLDIIGCILWEFRRVFGERSPEPTFMKWLKDDLANHFASFGFEDAWHRERNARPNVKPSHEGSSDLGKPQDL